MNVAGTPEMLDVGYVYIVYLAYVCNLHTITIWNVLNHNMNTQDWARPGLQGCDTQFEHMKPKDVFWGGAEGHLNPDFSENMYVSAFDEICTCMLSK